MKWTRKKVTVTGGASFIGSHLVESLVNKGADVTVADDLSSGRRENLSNVTDEISLLIGDLRDRAFAEKVLDNADVVFHLAATHGGRGFISTHPADCAMNMALDCTVLEAAHRAGVSNFCFASSACVYPTSLQSEGVNTVRKTLLKEEMADPFVESRAFADEEYGWSKLMGEMSLRAFNRQYGMKGVSCRIFTSYGPRENETHAVIALIAKAFAEMDPFEVWGTGEQDRNFTYVSDTVEGLIRASEKIDDASAINIGTSEHIKVREIAKMILDRTGFQPKKVFFDKSKPGGVYSRAADCEKCRELLDWEPRTKIDAGLTKTIDWYYSSRNRDDVKKDINTLLFER